MCIRDREGCAPAGINAVSTRTICFEAHRVRLNSVWRCTDVLSIDRELKRTFLSGGERQRISIARCLLHAAPILLVDEATASLDRITSTDILNSILDLQDMTKIVVTHYLEESTLKRFDLILTVSDGHISEAGSFDELIERRELFYSLIMSGKEQG